MVPAEQTRLQDKACYLEPTSETVADFQKGKVIMLQDKKDGIHCRF